MSIAYIDDVLIFSENIDSHFKQLKTFFNVMKANGVVVSAKKMVLFQTKNKIRRTRSFPRVL